MRVFALRAVFASSLAYIRVCESNFSRIRHKNPIYSDNFFKSESLKISSAEQHKRAFLRQLKFGRNSLVRRSHNVRGVPKKMARKAR